MPEDNVGFTAPLKNALDYLCSEWHHKPVGFVSYGMTSAGLRAVEMLKPVLTSLKTVCVHERRQHPAAAAPRRGRSAASRPGDVRRRAQLLAELRLLTHALAPLRATSQVDRDTAMVAS